MTKRDKIIAALEAHPDQWMRDLGAKLKKISDHPQWAEILREEIQERIASIKATEIRDGRA